MAEKEGELYFSPKYTFEEVKTLIERDERNELIEAFKIEFTVSI